MTPPTDQPDTRSVRFAVSAGTLHPALVRTREAEAQRLDVSLLVVLTEAELLHLRLIQKALPPGATWVDSVAAIRRCGVDRP